MPVARLSRHEFYSRIGINREIDPMTSEAYAFLEELERQKPNKGASADALWHLSFHASAFPGDAKLACGRKAIYTLMDAPRRRAGRWLSQIADAGKDVEDRLVLKWYLAGYLISAPPPPYGKYQTVYEDKEHWLTGTVDAETVQLRSDCLVVTEIKSKSIEVIREMQMLTRGPDEAHVKQLLTQIGLSHEKGQRTVLRCFNTGRLAINLGKRGKRDIIVCPQHGSADCLNEVVIQPPDYGRIYYVARDDPFETREFLYEYNPEFMRQGRLRLKEWQGYWRKGVLPQTHFSGKHPFGWNWTTPESPCIYCSFSTSRGNGICRKDHDAAKELGSHLSLDSSAAIEEAQIDRPNYDFDLVKAAVERRWLTSDLS